MNLQENTRKPSPYLRRRIEMLDYEVKKNLYGQPFGGINICIFFKSDVEYFESVMENSIDAMYFNYFSHIDDNSGEWAHTYLDMVNYIRENHQDKIMKHYDDNCGSGSIPLKESIRKVLRENNGQSKFFHRRIDLDEVKWLLPFNAKQIFHETESFKQFKYELTLRAVESIMWNEYNVGWEDLPEQEEIDFVTEVADIFEDIIIDLYKHYHDNCGSGSIPLKESIRRILREETELPISVRRRIY